MSTIRFRFGVGILVAFVALPPVSAQTTGALIGRVVDPSGAAIVGAHVTLENPLTGFQQQSTTQPDGNFSFSNLPLHTFEVTVQAVGFLPEKRTVAVRSNIPVALELALRVAARAEVLHVSAVESSALVDIEATGTRASLSLSSFERVPVPVGSRGLEAVLLSFPGFSQNANGAIHPRGAHNQMTYVIDGMPISDQLTGSFGNSLDPHVVQTIELFTGNIPAEFGSKISGVAHITTRSGQGTGRLFSGNIGFQAAEPGTLSALTQLAGETRRLGYFVSLFTLNGNRFLDQVSLANLHNRGNTERAFLRLDYALTPRDVLRFNWMTGRSWFQLANLRSQQAAGQDQRQKLRDFAAWVGWLHILSPRATLDATLSYRTSITQLFPSAGDRPVTAAQARHLSTMTLAVRLNAASHRHLLRAGFDVQRFPVSEDFAFGITDPSFNDPASERFRDTLLAHDLTRGGAPFRFSKKRSGHLHTVFVQDTLRGGRFTFSLGLRHDIYRFIVPGQQLQPRLGVAFSIRETGTVLRASYNRNYQTPPNENLLLSSSVEASRLVPRRIREALGGAFRPIQPERQNVYEVGLQQSLFGKIGLNASFYHKNSHDQQDNDNFLNTGIIFPTALKQIRVNGAELRLVLPTFRGLSGTWSMTHYRAVSTPPFTGGLFLSEGAVELLTARPFVIDHDQKLSAQAVLQYHSKRHFWTSWSVRYDSGLVANASDPARVAADPDYADLLRHVNLRSDPPRVRPRTIVDFAVGYERLRDGRRHWEAQFQVSNLTNRTALYNFQSVFVGTRVVAPRTLGVKLRWYW